MDINTLMTAPQDDPVLSTFFTEIGIISQLSYKAFEEVMPLGLTVPQFSVLNNLSRLGDGKSPSSLASAFQVTKGAMTNTLARLENSGMIEVCADQNDRRAKKVFLTPIGAKARAQALRAQAPLLNDLMHGFSEEEFAQAIPFLAKLRVHLDQARD